jgi:hypothetical protein
MLYKHSLPQGDVDENAVGALVTECEWYAVGALLVTEGWRECRAGMDVVLEYRSINHTTAAWWCWSWLLSTGQMSLWVAAKTISTPLWSYSVLLRLRRRIAYSDCSSKVISARGSFVLMKLRENGWSFFGICESIDRRKPAQATLHAVEMLTSGIELVQDLRVLTMVCLEIGSALRI